MLNARRLALVALLLPLLARAEAPPAQASTKTLLFKIEGKNGQQAWLLGSVHAATDATYPLDPRLEKAFDASKVLAVEVDIEKLDAQKVMQVTLAKAAFTDGRTLSQVISPETKKAFEAAAKSLGIGPEAFEPFQPWFAAVSLASVAVQKSGYDTEKGIDRHFLKKAGKRKVVELESLEQQIGLFAGFTIPEQDLLLRHALADVDVMGKEIGHMLDAWQRGDLAMLEKILTESVREHPEVKPVMDAVIGKRNRTMAAGIEKLLATKEVEFVVVGAGHVVGADGIVELLRKRGFTVTQQ